MNDGGLHRGEESLKEAIEEMSRAQSERDALKALDGALDRAHSVEEWHKHRLGTRYFEGRNKSKAGQVLAGLTYARGLTHHQLARTGDLVDAYSNTYSDLYGTMKWRALVQLPPPHVKEKWDRDKHYECHVQGQGVLDSLKLAQTFLMEEITQWGARLRSDSEQEA